MRDAAADKEFSDLIERHAKVVRAAIRRALGPRGADLGDDVEQEVRLSLWKQIRGGKKIDHPVSYLYRAAMTAAWAILKREPAIEVEVEADHAVFEDGAVEARLRIDEMLGRLPEDQSRAVRAYLAGFNHTEVAALHGWSESVARHRIYRALERLRREFGPGGER